MANGCGRMGFSRIRDVFDDRADNIGVIYKYENLTSPHESLSVDSFGEIAKISRLVGILYTSLNEVKRILSNRLIFIN